MFCLSQPVGRSVCFAPADIAFSQRIARLAVRSLHAELTLYPKPGLVSPIDNGSHTDMTAATFMRSLFALRHYFNRITQAGIDDAAFGELKRLAIAAEHRMLCATGGINTHRGAIFCIGMLCAAIGRAHALRLPLASATIQSVLRDSWGDALAGHSNASGQSSHGLRVAALHAVGGAREEAARGLPSVFAVALPALRRTLAEGRNEEAARIDAFFALMAHVSDTNVYHRGGATGAAFVRNSAAAFLQAGGTANANWRTDAIACHHLFVSYRLSPGGAADLLGAACFVHVVSQQADAGA